MAKAGKAKIMVQVWEPIAQGLDRRLRALHIRRDAFLNDLLEHEVEELEKEMGFRNEDEVRRYLDAAIAGLPNRRKLTLTISEEVIQRLDQVLKEKNVPRDSFINRILFFLLAKPSHLEIFGLNFNRRIDSEITPLADAGGSLYDPFFNIRSSNDGLFYTIPCFPDSPLGKKWPNLFGLNCAVEEQFWKIMRGEIDILADLDLLLEQKA